MKKSLLALAVLGAFAGVASAQSSVTLYGLIDANLGKDVGSADKRLGQGASSRLGFRGIEDLGGGSAAFFQLENRFTPKNGVINGSAGTSSGSPLTLWQARSYVGLRGGWGEVRLGREYNGAFFHGELMGDPWGWDTVAFSVVGAVMRNGVAQGTNVNSAVTYNSPNFNGFSFTGQVAESDGNCGAQTLSPTTGKVVFGGCSKRPYSGGVSYAAGPLAVRLGYDNPGNDNDKWVSLNSQYDFGAFKLWGFLGSGTDIANNSTKSYMLAGTVPMGQGEFRLAFSRAKVGGTTIVQGVAVGYHYALSKRTTLYADIANNNKAAIEKTGYDFGIKHAF